MPYEAFRHAILPYFRHRFTFKMIKILLLMELFRPRLASDCLESEKGNNLQGRQGRKNGYPRGQKTGN